MTIFSQIGRSMVEMLGVLSIIGVLSIGGLYGLKQAKDSGWSTHLASEAVYITKELTSQDGWRSLPVGSRISIHDVSDEFQIIKEQGSDFKIILPPVTQSVCILLLPKLSNFNIYLDDSLLPDDKAIHCKNESVFTLRYNK